MVQTKATYPGDDDSERKTQAEVLLNAYSRELDRRRLAADAEGLLLNTGGKSLPPHGTMLSPGMHR